MNHQYANVVVASDDQFDRLPDELLLHILNKVNDARSLAQCLSVSKRLGSLVPQVDSVSLTVAPRVLKPVRKPSRSRFLSAVVKPVVRLLSRLVSLKSRGGDDCECSCHCPHEILKRFSEIQSLRVELPWCENEIGNLKWIADYGAELNGCIIIGANSVERREGEEPSEEKVKESAAVDPILSEKELKQRVVWIISCLIAASSRHLMLKELVEDHRKLEDVVITDANKQGKLLARKEKINEIRKSLVAESSEPTPSDLTAEKGMVPDLKMKLWHVPELELPESGFVMRGATLVVIKPTKDSDEGDDFCDWNGEGERFDGDGDGDEKGRAFGEALREMKKMKKSYSMEMNSF